jgi:hypothetical protein
MNYIKYKNEIYRLQRYCPLLEKMFYLKKISKIKTGKYFYVYLQGKRINIDRALKIVPEANENQIKEINLLNK